MSINNKLCCLLYILAPVTTTVNISITIVFLGDLWPESERKENPQEPSWVQSEKDQFRDYRDKDKDGKLNKVKKQQFAMFI